MAPPRRSLISRAAFNLIIPPAYSRRSPIVKPTYLISAKGDYSSISAEAKKSLDRRGPCRVLKPGDFRTCASKLEMSGFRPRGPWLLRRQLAAQPARPTACATPAMFLRLETQPEASAALPISRSADALPATCRACLIGIHDVPPAPTPLLRAPPVWSQGLAGWLEMNKESHGASPTAHDGVCGSCVHTTSSLALT